MHVGQVSAIVSSRAWALGGWALCTLALAGCDQVVAGAASAVAAARNAAEAKADPQEAKPAQPATPRSQSHKVKGAVSVPEQNFSIVPPSGWRAGAKVGPSFLAYGTPPQDGFAANFNVIAAPDDGEPLDATPAQVRAALPRIFKNWRVIDDGFIEIGGRRVYRLASSCEVQRVKLRMLQFFLKPDNGKQYTLTFTVAAQRYAGLEGTFERCASTMLVE